MSLSSKIQDFKDFIGRKNIDLTIDKLIDVLDEIEGDSGAGATEQIIEIEAGHDGFIEFTAPVVKLNVKLGEATTAAIWLPMGAKHGEVVRLVYDDNDNDDQFDINIAVTGYGLFDATSTYNLGLARIGIGGEVVLKWNALQGHWAALSQLSTGNIPDAIAGNTVYNLEFSADDTKYISISDYDAIIHVSADTEGDPIAAIVELPSDISRSGIRAYVKANIGDSTLVVQASIYHNSTQNTAVSLADGSSILLEWSVFRSAWIVVDQSPTGVVIS